MGFMKVFVVRKQNYEGGSSIVHVASSQAKARVWIKSQIYDQEQRYVKHNQAFISKYQTPEEQQAESKRRLANSRSDYDIDDFVVDAL